VTTLCWHVFGDISTVSGYANRHRRICSSPANKSVDKDPKFTLHGLKTLQLIVRFFFILLASTFTSCAAARTVVLGDNGCANSFYLFVFLFDLL